MTVEHKAEIHALVVCDNIYTEPGGKSALVGLFNNITAPGFPAKHPRLAVYVSLTNIHSGSSGKLDIVHGESDRPLVEARGQFPDDIERTDVVDMSFILNNVVFPESGIYFIRFFVNDFPLVMKRLELRQSSSQRGTV